MADQVRWFEALGTCGAPFRAYAFLYLFDTVMVSPRPVIITPFGGANWWSRTHSSLVTSPPILETFNAISLFASSSDAAKTQ